MKKLLYILLAAIIATSAAQAAPPSPPTTKSHAPAKGGLSRSAFGAERRKNRSIMELPLFERAVLIIKKYETLHRPKDWPYVGYGHQVQPGEPYWRGCQLTEAQADALLRKDLHKFCSLYTAYGRDSILLACLAYNCGPGVVQKSSVLKKLKRGDRNIAHAYASHCRYRGKFHRGIHQRRLVELAALFIP